MAMKKCPQDLALTPPMLNVLLYGHVGSRKTSIAQTAEDTFSMDFDNGAHRSFNRRYCVRFETWKDVSEIFADPKLADSKTLVIDTVGRLLDLLTADVRTRKASFSNGASLSPLGWGVLKSDFVNWLKNVKNFGRGARDCVMIAHHKEKQENDKTMVRPEIPGGSYAEVLKDAEIVGYVSFKESKPVINFAPTETTIGKNSAGWGEIEVPELSTHPDFLAKLLAEAKTKIGQVSEANARAATLIADWSVRIMAMDADELNTTGLDFAKSQTVSAIKAGIVFWIRKRAEKLNLKYDRIADKYLPIITPGAES